VKAAAWFRNVSAVFILLGSIGAAFAFESAGATFQLAGQVQTPATFDAAALRKLPAVHKEVTYLTGGGPATRSFTGALLWDVLQSAGGIVVDPDVKNGLLRKIIIVTGGDGYVTVFSAGEIAPDFGDAPILVAYEANGQALYDGGSARIVVPGDRHGGRFVSRILKIEVQSGAN
jgi:DMSO/TMAO reductase YedYZ molybdopterin-dependent catalytic subunit